ncbi:MAG: hypothetical protein WC608_00015 [Parcubacteria group bacterium]
MVKKLLKCVYSWKTLALGLLFFVVAYFVANILFTPFGGCAGCIPDGTGGVACVNECQKISPINLATLSYMASFLIMIIFSFIKRNDKQNIA